MEFRGRLCTVRSWRASDLASLVKYADNLNVARHLRDRFPHPYTARAGRGFLKTIAAAAEPNVFAIDVNGEAAGGIGISPGADVERFSAEIGYWLGEPFWGRGITVEALLIVSQYAFETRNLLRLFALPFADNRQSIRVLEKAGYALEGTLRSSSVKSGVIRDQALYALVNTAWKA
jgi:ribosomal-protein-alanine N-acetyltransferase